MSFPLPTGWEVSPAKVIKVKSNGDALHYKGEPEFEITMSQNSTVPQTMMLSLPFECDTPMDTIRGSMYLMQKQRGDTSPGVLAQPRPDYIPPEYYSRILVVPKSKGGPDAIAVCLYLGNSTITLTVTPAPSSKDGPRLTPILQSIADSGRKISTLSYAPVSLHLPILGVTASMTSGIWALGTISLPAPLGQRDLLIRDSGIAELKIIPLMSSGTCSVGTNNNFQKKNPPYVSSEWAPRADEKLGQSPVVPLQLTVCRQIGPTKILAALMYYGAEAVSDSDAPMIARALDDIADAVIKEQGQ